MKKGKKGWLLLMAFITWTALLTGCEKWFGNKPDKMPGDTTVGADKENMKNLEKSQSTPLPDIQELTYYVHGTMVESIWSISLLRQEKGALIRVEPWNGEEEEFFDYPVAAEILDKARTILENYNVASWAGFCGRDPNALDGYSMKF